MAHRGKNLREIWLSLMVLGIIVINFPFIRIFDKPEFWFGFPPLFIYFFVGWGITILVLAIFSITLTEKDDEEEQ